MYYIHLIYKRKYRKDDKYIDFEQNYLNMRTLVSQKTEGQTNLMYWETNIKLKKRRMLSCLFQSIVLVRKKLNNRARAEGKTFNPASKNKNQRY